MRVTVDNRDPWPHPWAKFLPEGWEVVRGALETGDVVLSALPEGAVIERKTPGDMASCIGASRERFERELRRGLQVNLLVGKRYFKAGEEIPDDQVPPGFAGYAVTEVDDDEQAQTPPEAKESDETPPAPDSTVSDKHRHKPLFGARSRPR